VEKCSFTCEENESRLLGKGLKEMVIKFGDGDSESDLYNSDSSLPAKKRMMTKSIMFQVQIQFDYFCCAEECTHVSSLHYKSKL
jgi:hypothetical protein